MRNALWLILAAMAGVMTVLAFAPYRLYWIMPLSLAILAYTIGRGQTSPFRLGYVWGLAAYLCNFNWIFISLHEIAGLPILPASALTLLLPAYLALYPGLAAWMSIRIGQRFGANALGKLLLFPASWTLAEWLRGWMLTGFPWGQAGYSQITESPLAGYTPIGGILLVTLAVAMSGSLLAALLRPGRWQRLLSALALAGLWSGGYALQQIDWTTPVGKPISVALAQGNIPQSIKWDPASYEETLSLYAHQIAATHADLMILPETALPLFLDDLPSSYIDLLQNLAAHNHMALAIGVPRRGNKPDHYFNAVVALSTPGMPFYAKSHLVPFGEFIPLPWLTGGLYQLMNIPMASFSAGASNQAPLDLAGQKIAFNICYEDSFGEELIGPAAHATMLANVSNLAWFGKSTAASQHLQLSQARALETGRYILRATNTGMTAIIRPNGAVDAIAAPFTQQVLTGFAEGRTGLTPYMQVGNRLALGLCLLLVVLVITSTIVMRNTRPATQ